MHVTDILKIAENESNILNELQITGDILILTIHRAENVDDPERLKNIVEALLELRQYHSGISSPSKNG